MTKDADIHSGYETVLVNTDGRGRGHQPKGQTPMAYAVSGARHKLLIIRTATIKGRTRWVIVNVAFKIDKLIEYLAALVKDADKIIFRILENLRVHHIKPVKAWLTEHKG